MTPVTEDEADGQDRCHRHGPQSQQYTGDAVVIPRRPKHREIKRGERDGDHEPGDSEIGCSHGSGPAFSPAERPTYWACKTRLLGSAPCWKS